MRVLKGMIIHVQSGSCSNFEGFIGTGPGRNARQGFSIAWQVLPGNTIDGRIAGSMGGLYRDDTIALNKAYDFISSVL